MNFLKNTKTSITNKFPIIPFEKGYYREFITLVELIVVVTILSILLTIAFISLQ